MQVTGLFTLIFLFSLNSNSNCASPTILKKQFFIFTGEGFVTFIGKPDYFQKCEVRLNETVYNLDPNRYNQHKTIENETLERFSIGTCGLRAFNIKRAMQLELTGVNNANETFVQNIEIELIGIIL